MALFHVHKHMICTGVCLGLFYLRLSEIIFSGTNFIFCKLHFSGELEKSFADVGYIGVPFVWYLRVCMDLMFVL